MSSKRNVILYTFLVLALWALGTFIHEAAHALIAVAFGSKILSFGVMSIQLYPEFEQIAWNGWIAYLEHTGTGDTWQRGLVQLMGSGATSAVGYLAIVLLLVFRPKGFIRLALLAMAVTYALDIIAYSVFPLIGLRHAIFIGGDFAEPAVGAEKMGIPQLFYYIILVLHTAIYYGLIACYLRRCNGKNIPAGVEENGHA